MSYHLERSIYLTSPTTYSLSPELLKSTVSINLEGAFFAVQAAARQMKEQTPQGGSIIGVSSISALVGGAGQTHYTPTKAGILSLMQSCACALGPYNIRCNALLPGTIRTQLNDEDLADPKKKEYMEGRIPLRRLGQPHVCISRLVMIQIANELSGSCWTRGIPRVESFIICCKFFPVRDRLGTHVLTFGSRLVHRY
jgi:NAD(P)-dependent dehydrogenase (short-subunit alcohol dehydrogenase family)